jgi:hypothetical protein
MSKGSRPRPFSVSQAEYDNRWDAIFSRDLKKEDDDKAEEEAFKAIEERNSNLPKDSEQNG